MLLVEAYCRYSSFQMQKSRYFPGAKGNILWPNGNIRDFSQATGRKKCQSGKNVYDFTLLCKLLAELSCLHPTPTMVSADYRCSIPLLPTMPSPDRNNSVCSWLIVVCLGARWGAPRRPWDNSGCHGWKVCLVLVLLLCCVLFYVEAIVVVTENRLRSIINDNLL